MTRLAKRLPVALIPEQLLVTTMRYNMVNDGGLCYPSLLLTLHTQWVAVQESNTCLLPTTVVPTLAGAVSVALVQCLVLVAVRATTIRHQCWAPRMLARYAWSVWHTITPS